MDFAPHLFMGGIQVGTQEEKRTTVFSIAIRPLRGASDRKAPTSGGGYLLHLGNPPALPGDPKSCAPGMGAISEVKVLP